MLAALSPEAVNWVLGIPWGILAVSCVTGWVLLARLYRILRTRHPETYEKLGRPVLFSRKNGLAGMRFILGGHFRELDDPELLRFGRFLRIFFLAYFAWLLCLIVLAFAVAPMPYPHRP